MSDFQLNAVLASLEQHGLSILSFIERLLDSRAHAYGNAVCDLLRHTEDLWQLLLDHPVSSEQTKSSAFEVTVSMLSDEVFNLSQKKAGY